jgi:hypothetical protein
MLHAGHSSTQLRSVITITGLGDHDQPDWLITMTGIRKQARVTAKGRQLPLAMLVNKCLLVHVTHSTADVPIS